MKYKNGFAFEEAMFGRSSYGQPYTRYEPFSEVMQYLVGQAREKGQSFPRTYLAEITYRSISQAMSKLGVSTDGLMLLDCLGSKADFHHYTDGFLYLPEVPNYPVTIDLFNLDSENQLHLKERWSSRSNLYSEEDFQSDLFLYKRGVSRYFSGEKEESDIFTGWTKIFNLGDFRSYAGQGVMRPENHLIFTPFYANSGWGRGTFSRLVARSFLGATRVHKVVTSY